MTKREFLTMVAAGEMNEEIMAMGAAELEKMEANLEKRKGYKSEKDKAKAEENQAYIEKIVNEVLGEEPMTATDISPVVELTVQKVSGLMRMAEKQGLVVKSDVKVKGKGLQKGYSKT